MSGARELLGAEAVVLATAKQTIASPATTAFVFSPVLYLPGISTWKPGMRLVLIGTATTAGTTSTLTWVVQDADDNAGAIGTPATALTDSTGGTLAGGTGDDYRVIGIRHQQGRPWLKVSVTHATATDSFVCAAVLLGIPASA
jgi:hypothetical protein